MIKLESFVMPSSTYANNMMNRDLFYSKDMIISPALLDFLEQTLEPFDLIKASFESASTPGQSKPNRNFNDEEDMNPKTSQTESANRKSRNTQKPVYQQQESQELKLQEPSYFPVDVVVFVSMLPSSIRFTCLPQSTMECLLKLPSLEMVFSTSRLDGQNQTKLENILKSDQKSDDFLISNSVNFSNEGGLNLTCSLSDFSLKFYNRLAIRNPFDNKFFYNENAGILFNLQLLKINLKP